MNTAAMDTAAMNKAETILVLNPVEINGVPWRPIPGCPGTVAKDLWRSGDLHDALISYEPGSGTPGRPHPGADHHIWVISGSASIAGRPVGAGCYVHIPPGTEHPITDVGEEGCLLLQMHRPLPNGTPR